MRWLAVDPSLRNTGWAIMDHGTVWEVGLICTERDKSLPVYLDNQRCLELICCGMRDAHQACGLGADLVYAEAKGGSKSAKAAAAMAMAQGVLIGSLASRADIHLMLPQKVKQIVCGNRSASKDDIRAAVDKLYPNAFEMMVDAGYKAKKYNEHIYDAIAIGWAINKERKGL